MKLRFLLRDIVHSRSQALVFVLCVALSLVCIVAINSFRRDVQTAIVGDARALHGGDVIVRSSYPFSAGLEQALTELLARPGVTGARSWEMFSVVRRADEQGSLLAGIKVVEPAYPLYGRIDLASGKGLAEVLRPGRVVVAPAVLDRLGLAIGDQLLVGHGRLVIADLITAESLRSVDFFNFGPRVLVAAADLATIRLVEQGSRVRYRAMLRLDDGKQIAATVAALEARAVADQELVATYATAGSRVKRLFDNLFFFLSLVAVFTMLLAGIGMQSSLAALLRGKERSIATLRAIGADSRFLLRHYLLLVLLLSSLGAVLGIAGGMALERLFVDLFGQFLPDNLVLGTSLTDIIEGLAVGLAVVAFFTLLPLAAIREVKPKAVFSGSTENRPRRRETWVLLACGTFLLGGLVVRQLADLQVGLSLMAGILGLIAVISLLVGGLLAALRRLRHLPLPLRQAVRSLLRPGNASRSIVATLAAAFSVLLAIYLLQANLRAGYIDSYPPDAPNLFTLDIQKDQRQDFHLLLGEEVPLYPVIRARLTAINGNKIDRRAERKGRGDSLTREFSLSYPAGGEEDEELIAGRSLFPAEPGGRVPVSVLDNVAKMGDMRLGDVLEFNIQGVPLVAEVSSIRTRTRSMLFPFFYFLFPEEHLAAAPQTFFAALRVPAEEVSALENRIVSRFPNISTIDVGRSAAELAAVVDRLALIVTFFASFAILAGGLILVSSILATRLERIREVVHYKILGADSRFVVRVFFLENLLLGLFSGICALLVGQFAAFALCTYLFEVVYQPAWAATIGLVVLMVLAVVALGLAGSVAIIRRRPARYLRELP